MSLSFFSPLPQAEKQHIREEEVEVEVVVVGRETHTQCNQILPRSLRSRYSAASINICTSPIAAIFNNNTANNKTIRGRDSEAVHKPLDWLSFLTLSCLSLLSFSLRKTKNKNRRQETSRWPPAPDKTSYSTTRKVKGPG